MISRRNLLIGAGAVVVTATIIPFPIFVQPSRNVIFHAAINAHATYFWSCLPGEEINDGDDLIFQFESSTNKTDGCKVLEIERRPDGRLIYHNIDIVRFERHGEIFVRDKFGIYAIAA